MIRGRVKLYGVGINDADYVVYPRINGAIHACPFYVKWKDMLKRAYSDSCHADQPTYNGISVCEEWHLFSNFKAWMEEQDWKDKQLDKDLLASNNKVYSPDTCVFVTRELNNILNTCTSSRGEYPLWVCCPKRTGKFVSYMRCDGRRLHLGTFSNPMDAHRAGQVAKIKALTSAMCRTADNKIVHALTLSINKLQFDIDNGLETNKL